MNLKHVEQDPAKTGRFVEPERLFAALDGRHLTVLGRQWRVNIYSVCDRAGWRWIQLALEGDSSYMLTLKTAGHDGVRALVPALLLWLLHPSGSGGVLHLRSTSTLI